MAASTQPLAGVYVWEAPGKPIAVHFDLAIVDNLLAEVMRGFAAVPKRGAEVGGVLIGTIEPHQGALGHPRIVRIDDFELVPCVYARGPSYLLTSEDRASFEAACARRRPEASGPAPRQVVGYFRSHTRAGLSLDAEDLELLDKHFPDPSHIALLIRPFASKPAEAGFFLRDDGAFPQESPRTFVFSRLDMAGAPIRASAVASDDSDSPASRSAAAVSEPTSEAPATSHRDADVSAELVSLPLETAQAAGAAERPRAGGFKWIWIPLSITLLLVGAIAGFEAAQTLGVSIPGRTGEFSLALRVVPIGDNLSIRWDPQAPAVRRAQNGLLEIEDGGYSKPVNLDSAHLQSGNILYRSTSPSVRFRLMVYEGARVSVTETVDWPH